MLAEVDVGSWSDSGGRSVPVLGSPCGDGRKSVWDSRKSFNAQASLLCCPGSTHIAKQVKRKTGIHVNTFGEPRKARLPLVCNRVPDWRLREERIGSKDARRDGG
ncbi:hypothetical protein SKAU_G00018230 [Synaphobranchus kaupii]|uniref:Uncharacterized protein n=1 Tax=Synaphobranchus kaupii TaxID=118154 RepID=A0A9Q1JDM0_SYNKA|nr:hypothetical protein SKAU_G00018230 [Synaphobranchus kaupii]